jgi:hypothetical protein
MDDERPGAGPFSVSDRGGVEPARGEPVGPRQHRSGRTIRPRCSCDPCGGATRESRGPHGCASAGGSRAPCGGDGCSAGTCACSRACLRCVGSGQVCVAGLHSPGLEPAVFDPHRAPARGAWQPVRRDGGGWRDVGMRHRSTPVRPPNGTGAVERGQTEQGAPVGVFRGTCGQPLDPQAPALLACGVPEFPTVDALPVPSRATQVSTDLRKTACDLVEPR